MKIWKVIKSEYEWLGGSMFRDSVEDYYVNKKDADTAAEFLNIEKGEEDEYYSCWYHVESQEVKEA